MLRVIDGETEARLVELATNATGLDPEWKKQLQNKYPLV